MGDPQHELLVPRRVEGGDAGVVDVGPVVEGVQLWDGEGVADPSDLGGVKSKREKGGGERGLIDYRTFRCQEFWSRNFGLDFFVPRNFRRRL